MDLYARPYRAQESVICIDEKSKQLIRVSRAPRPMKPGVTAKYDYEYVRAGTCNLFVAVEPRGGLRVLKVTERRTMPEFVGFVRELLEQTYRSARKNHPVLDNVNTYFRSCFDDVSGRWAARALPRRVKFHYTPTHAGWLNMAQIEIGVLERQCLGRRLMDRITARREVNAWQRRSTRHRVDVHPSRRRPKARSPLCFVINVFKY